MYVFSAYTDVASLVLFDPVAAPADFKVYEKDGTAALQSLDEAGNICWMPVSTNGGHLLQIYLEREIPEYLAQYVKQPPRVYEAFPVPSGQLVFSGAEYFSSKNPLDGIRSPFSGGALRLPAGIYRLTHSEAEYPDGMIDELFRQRATKFQYRIHRLYKMLFSLGGSLIFLSLFGGLAILAIILKSSVWFLIGFLIMLLPIPGMMILRKTSVSRAAEQIWERLQATHPRHLVSLYRVNEMAG
jgi:hypothetical protein